MTRRHRRGHLVIWIVLGPLMLIALAVAISIRPTPVASASEPRATGGSR